MADTRSFEDLDVWKKSIDLAEIIYLASRSWPNGERFGLFQQIRRSASSAAANIAEGAERDGTKDFLRFLSIANGSLAETKTFLILAERLKYLTPADAGRLQASADEIRRMLAGLKRSLSSRLDP
ncbi:MAG TPA: four helix bundle protein [Parvularcula sp.]|nr:four helix bundle protein [Parvularcula sp.]HBS30380.1 four helix bundle protein [Parvularcula sp.]HBS36408.1 four helix bundle protein [Parvularcula sp.]